MIKKTILFFTLALIISHTLLISGQSKVSKKENYGTINSKTISRSELTKTLLDTQRELEILVIKIDRRKRLLQTLSKETKSLENKLHGLEKTHLKEYYY